MNNVITLKDRPLGKPSCNDFDFTTEPMPHINSGEILLKTLYVSVDPYLRGRMNDSKSYASPFQLNKPMVSGIVAEVTESENSHFNKGDFVSGMLQWKEYQLSNGEKLMKLDPKAARLFWRDRNRQAQVRRNDGRIRRRRCRRQHCRTNR
jgi:NADPH-dependent curcumin reductase CurA